MKKERLLPALAWVGGIAGFALRRSELADAYDAQTKLMRTDCPQTVALCVLVAALFILFAISCHLSLRTTRAGGQAGGTGLFYPTLAVSAAFILMLAGGVGLWQNIRLHDKNIIALIACASCFVAGACIPVAAVQVYRDRRTARFPILLMAPSMCSLVWLIVSYQQNAKQPVLLLYMWQLLAQVAVVLALYTMVSLSLNKGNAGRVCTFGLMGISLSLIALADGFEPVQTLLYLFALLYLTAQTWLLLRDTPVKPTQEETDHGI